MDLCTSVKSGLKGTTAMCAYCDQTVLHILAPALKVPAHTVQVLLTDTVGFIQKLPTQLVAAFRATLEEITEASLLLHVVDVSHPNAAAQTQAVMKVCCPCYIQ